jgi:hypothetical protein
MKHNHQLLPVAISPKAAHPTKAENSPVKKENNQPTPLL